LRINFDSTVRRAWAIVSRTARAPAARSARNTDPDFWTVAMGRKDFGPGQQAAQVCGSLPLTGVRPSFMDTFVKGGPLPRMASNVMVAAMSAVLITE